MIHSVEDKTQKELVEIVNIQMEEYSKLLNRNVELESQLVDVQDGATGQTPCAKYCEARATHIEMRNLKRRAEAAEKRLAEVERERDLSLGFIASKIPAIDALSSKSDVARLLKDDHLQVLNKFAIEQQIDGMQRVLDCRELNLSQGEIDTVVLMQEQLRQQLNGGE